MKTFKQLKTECLKIIKESKKHEESIKALKRLPVKSLISNYSFPYLKRLKDRQDYLKTELKKKIFWTNLAFWRENIFLKIQILLLNMEK